MARRWYLRRAQCFAADEWLRDLVDGGEPRRTSGTLCRLRGRSRWAAKRSNCIALPWRSTLRIDLRERDLPQETGQQHVLNFAKGCYVGQEIVERIRSRGNVHRMFVGLEVQGDRAGSGRTRSSPATRKLARSPARRACRFPQANEHLPWDISARVASRDGSEYCSTDRGVSALPFRRATSSEQSVAST